MTRRRGIALAIVAALAVLIAVFDWDWFRHPLENYLTKKTQREFRISHLGVKLGLIPTITMRDVHFANAPWSQAGPMARAGKLEFSVSLRDTFAGRIMIPRVALSDADIRLERTKDGQKNWVLSEPSQDQSPSRLSISSLSVTHGHLSYVDQAMPFTLNVAADTFDPHAAPTTANADAAPINSAYTTRYVFDGAYRDAKFAGDALTGDVLSFQESGINFPLRGHLKAGTTTLDVEGTVADAAKLSAIDVRLKISGQTLANLYPFLLLPLPASPPYQLEGHLTQSGARYGFDDFRGRIGQTDVSGSGGYVQQSPRPLLQAKLHSKLLNVEDLGPLIGVTTKSTPSPKAAAPTQAETNTRPAAQAKEHQASGGRVLPAGTPPGDRLLPSGAFEGDRLKAIDAETELVIDKVRAPDQLAVDRLHVVARLKDGVLRLDPFDLAIAGGEVVSKVSLDATKTALRASADVDAKRLQLAKLLPNSPRIAESKGVVGGRVQLKGEGNSIADLAAKSNGQLTFLMSKGEVSNLLDAAAGLNGGKVIRLLVGGDQNIALRCGVMAFDVKNGLGKSTAILFDTEQTRINGSGDFDLGTEHFDMTIAPQPKQAGILSLRTPVRLYGSFRHPDFELQKKELALRAGGAVALAFVAPWAALLPLIETGPGDDANCAKVYAQAQPQPAAGERRNVPGQ